MAAIKKPRLIALYREILRAAAIWTDDEGFCSTFKRDPVTKKDDMVPVTIKGKRLVVPTEHQLSSPDWEHRVAFHPLYETAGKGESEVQSGYRTYLNVHLNRVFGIVFARLLTLAASKKEHEALTPDQTEYLSLVKDADNKMVEDELNPLLTALPGDKAFVNLYIKSSGLVKGEKFAKVAVVSFPFFEALESAEKAKSGYTVKIVGVEKPIAIRTKARDTMMALMKYIIPNIAEKHTYDTGSLSQLAPTMDALMNATARLVGPLNDLLNLFKNQLIKADQGVTEEDWNRLVFPTDWAEDFKDLGPLSIEIRSTPMMLGNEAAVVQPTQTAAAQQAAPVPVPAAPQQQVAPGRVPFPPQRPAYQPQGYQPAYQRQEPQGPQLTPSGKLDFNSVARNAPQSGYQGQYQQGPAERTPGWARGGGGGYSGGGRPGYGGGYGGGRKAF